MQTTSIKNESASRMARLRAQQLDDARWDGRFEADFERLAGELCRYVKLAGQDWGRWRARLVRRLGLLDDEAARLDALYEAAEPHVALSRSESAAKAALASADSRYGTLEERSRGQLAKLHRRLERAESPMAEPVAAMLAALPA